MPAFPSPYSATPTQGNIALTGESPVFILTPLSGNATAVTGASGTLRFANQRISGNAYAITGASGTLRDATQRISGNASASTGASGTLRFAYQRIAGNASATTGASGALSFGLPMPVIVNPTRTFKLAGLSIPYQSHLDLAQSYEEERATRVTRHADGSARKQTAWRGKIKTKLTGSGWYPPGLEAIDYDGSLEMHCIAAKCVTSAARVIEIPAARRADYGYAPYAAATVDGGRVEADIDSLVGDVVTVAALAGAQYYHVYYYPRINVFADAPSIDHDAITDKYTWALEAREI